jgi:hypothetical protein
VIGASRIATPADEFTVCTTCPVGLSNNNCTGTLLLVSAAIEIACVPAGNVTLRSTDWPAVCVELASVVVPGPAPGDPVAVALPRQNPSM